MNLKLTPEALNAIAAVLNRDHYHFNWGGSAGLRGCPGGKPAGERAAMVAAILRAPMHSADAATMTHLRLNADFDRRIVVPPPDAASWQPSPEPGVHRHRLDRVGGEVARATSIVRYDAGSRFARHVHGGGEEFLVLEGTFSDERGDHPAGSYVRNPPGTAHAPYSREGCTLFVKLWQFGPGDTTPVEVDTRRGGWRPGLVPGLAVLPLHEHNGISTALVRWAPNTRFNTHTHPGGEEILVLEGLFRDEHGEYPAGSWLRSPRFSRHTPYTGSEGALIYVKVGHLGATLLQPPIVA